ncbi:protein farnesyltransferase [Mortierella sp. GBAus27b]|nr:CAAX geranylgeranyltransferase alpha subunit [Mortierella sp. GBA43]KAI8358237.1 protein farnesyltransferase [Mortierella sp. GBAus27b]
MADEQPFYEKPEWADVVPIPQDDGPNPLVPIAYSKEYSKTMDYFRAICRAQEMSQRALELTKIVIELSPSHYTVWHYRQKLLETLNTDMEEELEWTVEMVEENPKSYQIWHHRQVIIERLSKLRFPTFPTVPVDDQDLSAAHQAFRDTVQNELDVIAKALEEDSKNYHAWSYRQWVLAYFGKGPWWEEELAYVDGLLTVDVRNNSAWNQRFYVVTGGPKGFTEEIVQREVQYAKSKIENTPSNESPWVYLAGILNKAKHPLTEVKVFCEGLLELPRANFSPYVHSMLLDIYEQEAKEQKTEESVSKAREEAIMLAEKVDVIRSKYWTWRKNQLKSIVVNA